MLLILCDYMSYYMYIFDKPYFRIYTLQIQKENGCIAIPEKRQVFWQGYFRQFGARERGSLQVGRLFLKRVMW